MYFIIILLVLHLLLFGIAVFALTVADKKNIIFDPDVPTFIAFFLPIAVLIWILATYIAEKIGDCIP